VLVLIIDLARLGLTSGDAVHIRMFNFWMEATDGNMSVLCIFLYDMIHGFGTEIDPSTSYHPGKA